MITIKSYTDIEQSRKLAEILPIESADMGWYYTSNPNAARNQMWVGTKAENADIPCWSLAALIGVLPEHNLQKTDWYYIQKTDWYYKIEYKIIVTINEDNYASKNYDNPIDACYEMILKLHEQKLLNYDTRRKKRLDMQSYM